MRDPVLLVTVIEELDDVRTPDVVELATEIAELLVRVEARTPWLMGRAFAHGRERARS
jgi:hypothetical protein